MTPEVKQEILEAIKKSFRLGEMCFSQADSNSFSQWKKAALTYEKYKSLLAEIEGKLNEL